MSDNKDIKHNLNILGISSYSQLEKNNLEFWWVKEYSRIRNSKEKEQITNSLIALNNAKEFIEDFSIEELKDVLESNYNILEKDSTTKYRYIETDCIQEEASDEKITTNYSSYNSKDKIIYNEDYQTNFNKNQKRKRKRKSKSKSKNTSEDFFQSWGYPLAVIISILIRHLWNKS